MRYQHKLPNNIAIDLRIAASISNFFIHLSRSAKTYLIMRCYGASKRKALSGCFRTLFLKDRS